MRCLTLFGPGGGKSTVLRELHARLSGAGIPCAHCSVTSALERAHPGVDTDELSRRAARMRLCNAADLRSGVLLVDH